MHELTTNAIKYGALGNQDGLIRIEWSVEPRGDQTWLRFAWTELRVAVDDAVRREGFGTELITQRVPYELKGQGEMEFRPTGLHVLIAFPLIAGNSTLQTDAGPALAHFRG